MDYEENSFEESLEEEGMYAEFGEGFEDDFDARSEKDYENAFAQANGEELQEFFDEESVNEDDYEFDSVVGGRDKKPIMSMLNKGKLSKYEMDDLLNQL